MLQNKLFGNSYCIFILNFSKNCTTSFVLEEEQNQLDLAYFIKKKNRAQNCTFFLLHFSSKNYAKNKGIFAAFNFQLNFERNLNLKLLKSDRKCMSFHRSLI